ncbi:hypothetical protein [Adhaeretor mobilis]|uniref:Uncharacterized protein n=1 Tax=Adhaeretor mobilis TaxID=1930276 RepID=A0A517MPT3_9BACT|nr:hypothetical protein [Adhaeretor mobilis]QDS96797.1 hypothetical protein HG15A2_00550 [Adhaeretor mobilis]
MLNTNDDRFIECPDLPQYGNQVTCCFARLPQSAGTLVECGIGFVALLCTSVGIRIGVKAFPENINVQIAFGAICVVVAIALWYAARTALMDAQKDALFVFEGGVHLNEKVLYMVPYGQLFTLNTGMRQVSLPWRVLKRLQLTDTQHDGQKHVEASLQLPDGRTMSLSTSDGEESAMAIQTIAQNLIE